MAELKKNGSGKEEPALPPKKKKGFLFLTIILVQIIAAIALVVFVIYPKFAGSTDPGADQQKEAGVKEGNTLGTLFSISNLTVNPKGSMGRRFAVFEVALEVHDPKAVEKLTAYKPVIVDQFLKYLRSKTIEEYSNVQEMDAIRNDLKNIANSVIQEKVVTNLYFTRYVLE